MVADSVSAIYEVGKGECRQGWYVTKWSLSQRPVVGLKMNHQREVEVEVEVEAKAEVKISRQRGKIPG